jgi:hypothetical protein
LGFWRGRRAFRNEEAVAADSIPVLFVSAMTETIWRWIDS